MKKLKGLLLELVCTAVLLCACTAAQLAVPGEEPSQALTWQEQYDLGIRYLSEGKNGSLRTIQTSKASLTVPTIRTTDSRAAILTARTGSA